MLDADVCEAVGLAHDLGHPPFGHATEYQLMHNLASKAAIERMTKEASEPMNKEPQWSLDKDAFEGNPQSFRVVCRLAGTHLPIEDADEFSELGLNLTRRTLNGLLKYPWEWENRVDKNGINHAKKWGAYEQDKKYLRFAREACFDGKNERRSLEAEIMDWADDITFAVHDLLDFYASGDIPIYLFLHTQSKDLPRAISNERANFIEDILQDDRRRPVLTRAVSLYLGIDVEDVDNFTLENGLNVILDGIFNRHLDRFDSRYVSSNRQRANISAVAFGMIEECLTAFKLEEGEDDGLGPWRLKINPKNKAEIEVLKQFTWHYIIRGQQLQYDEVGQLTAVKTVFNTLLSAVMNGKNLYIFPWHVRKNLKPGGESQLKTRHVIDYVASMSEPEIMRLYRQMIADGGYR
jgi:dGTPase